MHRRMILSLVLPLLVVAPLSAQTKHTSPPPDKALLQKVLDAWGSMDVTQPAKYYASDADQVYFDIAPLKYNGFAEYAQGTKEFFKTLKGLSFHVNDDAKVHMEGGKLAWSTATVDFKMTGTDDKEQAGTGRWTAIWQKRGSNWIIVHDHFSVPSM